MDKINECPVSFAGKLIYRFLPYRKAIVRANIDQVFGDQLSASQKEHLAKAFYSHLLTSIKEMIHLRFLSEKKLCERVDARGYERLLEIADEGKGVLVLTGHFGNWEFAPLGGILNFKQFQGQFHFIRRMLGNKTI